MNGLINNENEQLQQQKSLHRHKQTHTKHVNTSIL